MESKDSTIRRDTVIIGAGWSGLLCCKYMLEEGLSAVILEKRDDIGGVWRYSDDCDIPTVMKSTQCTSSSTVTEISDYPMPKEIGMFPHHTDVLEYLENYAKEFNLRPHIHSGVNVQLVERSKNEEQDHSASRWTIICSDGTIYQSKFLVVATGLVSLPNRDLEKTTLKGFTGPIYHAHQIKCTLKEFEGKNLLLVGGGETGSDVCSEWHGHAKTIYWSIPRGQHFFRRYSKVVPWGKPQALDKASSRMMKMIAPYHKGKPGLSWVCKWTTNGSVLAYQGHGIPEWKNNAGFFKFFINKNGKVLDLVDYKTVVPKGGIVKCEGKKVLFQDGTEKEFDLIIMSTGYTEHFPFLPSKYADVRIRQRYKMVFDAEDPTIAFVGLVRPIVGSLVAISEVQARWTAKVFSGKVPLSNVEERRKETEEDDAYWDKLFENSSQRLGGLVEGFTYTDSVARHAEIYPDYWSLFKRSPWKWLVAYTAPYNGATYQLNDSTKVDKCIQTMRSHQKGTLGPLQYLLIVLMRVLWIDWFFDKLGEVKYRIQVSRWWKVVKDWKLVQLANDVWTCPKRFAFDNISDERDEMSERARQFLKLKPRNENGNHHGNGSLVSLNEHKATSNGYHHTNITD